MRIGSNPSGVDLAAQRNLLQAYSQLNSSSLRLATMQRINSAAEDPAGLIAAENLRAELTAINQAADNAARAGAVVRTADSALGEVTGLLNTIRGNVVSAAGGGLGDEEIAALQMENNAALEAINRIGSTTSFGGRPLLDGQSLTFALSPNPSDTSTLQMPDVNTASLGSETATLADLAGGGTASLASGNLAEASDVLDAALDDIVEARVTMGTYVTSTIESSQEVLGSMQVSISSAFSEIFDTDVAEETSRMVRAQIRLGASTSSAMLAGQSRGRVGGLLNAS